MTNNTMSEIEAAIERHLGLQIRSEELTHYGLLGVESNASTDTIKAALRDAAAAWNKSDTKTYPESAQKVAKLLKQAQAILLDPIQRSQYDQAIGSLSRPIQSVSYYPEADPFSSFDPGTCLVGAPGEDAYSTLCGSANDRWQSLQREIPQLSRLQSYGVVTEQEEVIEVTSGLDDDESPPPSRSENAALRIEQMKRSRVLRQRMSLAAVLGLSTLFLGYAAIRFALNRQQIQNDKLAQTQIVPGDKLKSEIEASRNLEPSRGGKKDSAGSNSGSSKAGGGQRSGLPTINKDGESSDTAAPMIGDGSVPMEMDMKPPKVPVPEVQPIAVVPPPSDKPAEPKPEEKTPTAPMPEMKPDMTPSTSMAADGPKKEWVDAMKKAKAAVEKADFGTFHKQIELALPLASNDELLAKHKRLDQLGQLYEIFINAAREAKAKMRGSDVITVGKNKISIVELKEKELIVRVQGKNERYPWDRLPPGIALAIAELTLNDQDPTDIAARAVYFSLSPTRNELSAKKVKDWFAKSLGKGSIREDLPQALTDTYE